jgi:CRISPR/Cas system CSM-associated protein Csm3 (group 7 of RAMP superfamily)
MQMEAFLWLFLPVFVAGGSALLSYYVMQARMEVALAKERESLAEARAMISAHKVTLDERVKATEEACKRQALDDFMHDIRVDERSYVRESKSLNGSKKTMVMQERVFFRNIPLSNWIEREMLIEDGLETRQLPAESLFTQQALPTTVETPLAIARLLQEVKGSYPRPAPPAAAAQVIEPVLLTQHATAFGAQ